MKNMEDKKICPKCGREEKVKNGYNRGKQRYLCKNCGCNYTGTKNGYSEAVKQEAIKYYMEGVLLECRTVFDCFVRYISYAATVYISALNSIDTSNSQSLLKKL